jgi:hypothetical protein
MGFVAFSYTGGQRFSCRISKLMFAHIFIEMARFMRVQRPVTRVVEPRVIERKFR